MARLQILELPEGSDDERPPFALILDQVPDVSPLRGDTARIAQLVVESGARAFLITAETVEIPANEVLLPEPAELVAEAELRYERDEMRSSYEGACRTVADMHAAATGREGMGPVRGVVEDVEDVRMRAENAEGRAQAMEVQRDKAEAGRAAADNMLRAVCAVFGGPHADPVVKARETLARAVRAERSERNLVTLLGESRRSDVERMDQVTDALGLDRLRDWGEIVRALRAYRAASELYAETRPAEGGE